VLHCTALLCSAALTSSRRLLQSVLCGLFLSYGVHHCRSSGRRGLILLLTGATLIIRLPWGCRGLLLLLTEADRLRHRPAMVARLRRTSGLPQHAACLVLLSNRCVVLVAAEAATN